MSLPAAFGSFREVWLADFEFHAPPGERPTPICLVAREYRTGATIRLAGDALAGLSAAPFGTGDDTLFVAYFASAELGCFLSLNWPLPTRIVDLYCEFRNSTNGRSTPHGRGLLGALSHYGLDAMAATEKTEMRDLAIRGGPFTDAELSALVDYCRQDVESLARLLPAMAPAIDLPRALLRGRYMASVARMERTGTPIDTDTFAAVRENWGAIKSALIAEVDAEYGVYVPTGVRFDAESDTGRAITREAGEYEVDPHRVAAVVDHLRAEQREAERERSEAIRTARDATGLTRLRIASWEESGCDASTWPGLDVQARELAAEYPALGIGAGYVTGENYDTTDYAGALWELLRDNDRPTTRGVDQATIRRAAKLVYESPGAVGALSFSEARFEQWLIGAGVPWPKLESGKLALDDDTFRAMAKGYPEVAPLRELRHALGELRLHDLAVGADGRNRCLLSPFSSRTGRNQPSNSRFIFGPSCWLRGLIQPRPGRAVAYCDWRSQELGIAAALSGDEAMRAAYRSGDPYLAFAKQCGAVPADASKATHKAERDRFKVVVLAVGYGMEAKSLAAKLGQSEAEARELLELHRRTYPRFWQWCRQILDHATLRGWLSSVFGWRIHVGADANPRALANFPMQANGAEMMRLACCLLTERGVAVCCPVHDALLVEGDAATMAETVALTQATMREASELVLPGFPLDTDAEVVTCPDRYMDPRGQGMWATITGILERSGVVAPTLTPVAPTHNAVAPALQGCSAHAPPSIY